LSPSLELCPTPLLCSSESIFTDFFQLLQQACWFPNIWFLLCLEQVLSHLANHLSSCRAQFKHYFFIQTSSEMSVPPFREESTFWWGPSLLQYICFYWSDAIKKKVCSGSIVNVCPPGNTSGSFSLRPNLPPCKYWLLRFTGFQWLN
jgi:hypothetical protein